MQPLLTDEVAATACSDERARDVHHLRRLARHIAGADAADTVHSARGKVRHVARRQLAVSGQSEQEANAVRR